MSNSSFFAVTPSDSAALPISSYWVYVGVAGNLAVFGPGDSTATVIEACPVGWMRFPTKVVQIGATGTTATNIVVSAGDQPASH